MGLRPSVTLLILLLCHAPSVAQLLIPTSGPPADTIPADSPRVAARVFDLIDSAMVWLPKLKSTIADSLELSVEELDDLSRRKKKRLIRQFLGSQLDELNNIDTLYITPQLYNYAVMVQNTTTFENFSVSSAGPEPQTLRFSPKPTFRLGGYFGWRWIFLGYTFDVNGLLGKKRNNTKKTELDLSLYTSRVGIDLYYRKTGNDFRCTNLNSLFSEENPRPEGMGSDFSGLDIHTRGLNLYYIFNHRRFSYPAAFSQSTVQRRSCGSFKLGMAFTHHDISLNEEAFDARLDGLIDKSMFFNTVKYNDYSINFGYAYNWVFRRNWLFCASVAPALAYNVTSYSTDDPAFNGEESEGKRFLHFSFDKCNLDFILRVGLVYNDTKHFGGMSFILHSFDYKNDKVRLNNSFGSLNFYFGLNFKRKKKP